MGCAAKLVLVLSSRTGRLSDHKTASPLTPHRKRYLYRPSDIGHQRWQAIQSPDAHHFIGNSFDGFHDGFPLESAIEMYAPPVAPEFAVRRSVPHVIF